MAKRQASDHKALEELRHKASGGDPAALWELACAYEDGWVAKNGRAILKPDQRKAVGLYRLAADKGHTGAMNNLAICLERGRGTRKNPQEAFQWAKRAAQRGDVAAVNNVAITYRNLGKHRTAVRWFRKALANGDLGANLDLAKAELLGLGIRRNILSGMRRLRDVAWSSTPFISIAEKEEAALTGARIYMDGWLVPRNLKTAIKWLQKAAETDNEEAIALLREYDL